MKRIRLITCLFMLLLSVGNVCGAAEGAGWETLKSEFPGTKSVVKETEIEIKTAPSVIVVNATHPVQIKVFTILGRLVSSETLPPGVSRLTVGAHGVYIVKVGELTCKVAI